MSYQEYKANPRIIDRAVKLWIEMLQEPKYDNLGENTNESPDSVFKNTMAAAMTSLAAKNNTPEVLQRFGEELKKILTPPYPFTFKGLDDKVCENTRPVDYLRVDYGPDAPLAAAAELAGLKMPFPWKTTMHLNDGHVGVSAGYGAPYVYHYPLSSDRWLVTTLYGDDIEKIVALVEAGILDLNLQPSPQGTDAKAQS